MQQTPPVWWPTVDQYKHKVLPCCVPWRGGLKSSGHASEHTGVSPPNNISARWHTVKAPRPLARWGSHGVDGGNHFRGLALSSVWITGGAYLPICHLQMEVDTLPSDTCLFIQIKNMTLWPWRGAESVSGLFYCSWMHRISQPTDALRSCTSCSLWDEESQGCLKG